MSKVIVINGSPRMDRGNTAMLLSPFIEGMTAAGAEVDVINASRLNVQPCSCGRMACWSDNPGQCCIKDDMQLLYSKLAMADILVLATPVYIPLPGAMQNVINRLCPLMDPKLDFRDGRTRVRFSSSVAIRKIVLLATSSWFEVENFDTVIRIAKEIAEDTSVEFAGAIVRPHCYVMKASGAFTDDGLSIVRALNEAGQALINQGLLPSVLLEQISRPLISAEEFIRRWNEE